MKACFGNISRGHQAVKFNAMINEECDEVDTEKYIKRVYEQFYKQLLETPKAENKNEKRAEKR